MSFGQTLNHCSSQTQIGRTFLTISEFKANATKELKDKTKEAFQEYLKTLIYCLKLLSGLSKSGKAV